MLPRGMWSSLALSILVSAAPGETVLVLEVERDGVSESTATTIAALMGDALDDAGFDVLSAEDFERAMGEEAKKQDLGCVTDEACLSELVGAYDTDLVVFMRAAHLGETLTVSVTYFEPKIAKARARDTLMVAKVDELPAAIAASVRRSFPPDPWKLWVGGSVVGAGALALAAGATTLAILDARVEDNALQPKDRAEARTLGGIVGVLALIVGAGGVVGGVVVGTSE